MALSPEVQLATITAEVNSLKRDNDEQTQTLRRIEHQLGRATNQSARLDGRLTEL